MTAADGDGEPLRVPPWVDGGMQPGEAPQPPTSPAPSAPAAASGPSGPSAADEPDGTDLEGPAWSADPDGDWRAGRRDIADPGRRRMTLLLIASGLVILTTLAVGMLFDTDRTDPYGAGGEGVTGAPAAPPAPPPEAATPSPGTAETPSASPTRSEHRSASPARPSPTRYGPVTFEAEADGNTIGGSAWVTQYPGASGGRIVRNLGDWDSRQGDGFVRFEDVTVPVAGTYTLRLFHVNLDNEPTRTVVITVSGGDPRSFTLNGSSTCCTASTVQVELRKGRNTITIGNPDGHAPSLDRIVLSLR